MPSLMEIAVGLSGIYQFLDAKQKRAADKIQEEADKEEVRRSRAKILLELEMMDEDSLKQACEAMKTVWGISGILGRIKGPVSGWTDVARGLVWAKSIEMGLIAGSLLSTQLPSPSPAPE